MEIQNRRFGARVIVLGNDSQQRIGIKVEALAHALRPRGVGKLEGQENRYRVRVGDYRVIYEIQHAVLVVLVIRIGHRREIYRK